MNKREAVEMIKNYTIFALTLGVVVFAAAQGLLSDHSFTAFGVVAIVLMVSISSAVHFAVAAKKTFDPHAGWGPSFVLALIWLLIAYGAVGVATIDTLREEEYIPFGIAILFLAFATAVIVVMVVPEKQEKQNE